MGTFARMVSVRFVHHHTIDGVSYLPGQVVALPPDVAAMLVYASRAVYTVAPPQPPSADPLPQYVLDSELAAAVMAVLAAGANVVIDKNATTGKATISATVTGGAGGVDAEGVRDAVWAALRGTNGVQVTQDDAGDTITITVADVPMSAIAGLTDALAQKAPLASPQFTGTVAGITKAMVGLGNVANTAPASLPLSSAATTALAGKVDTTAVAETATGSKVVVRTLGGQGKFSDPVDANDAATRGWVAQQVAGVTPPAFTPTIENAPAASMFARVCVNGVWPTRGTVRTDVMVMWISTAATDPVPPIGGTGAIGNDVWLKVDA